MKPIQEGTSFINSLMNLTIQHLGRAGKKDMREIEERERFEYFLYLRDYLWREGMVKGIGYEMWCTEQYNTMESMTDSTKVEVFIDLMDQKSVRVDTSMGSSTDASSMK